MSAGMGYVSAPLGYVGFAVSLRASRSS